MSRSSSRQNLVYTEEQRVFVNMFISAFLDKAGIKPRNHLRAQGSPELQYRTAYNQFPHDNFENLLKALWKRHFKHKLYIIRIWVQNTCIVLLQQNTVNTWFGDKLVSSHYCRRSGSFPVRLYRKMIVISESKGLNHWTTSRVDYSRIFRRVGFTLPHYSS